MDADKVQTMLDEVAAKLGMRVEVRTTVGSGDLDRSPVYCLIPVAKAASELFAQVSPDGRTIVTNQKGHVVASWGRELSPTEIEAYLKNPEQIFSAAVPPTEVDQERKPLTDVGDDQIDAEPNGLSDYLSENFAIGKEYADYYAAQIAGKFLSVNRVSGRKALTDDELIAEGVRTLAACNIANKRVEYFTETGARYFGNPHLPLSISLQSGINGHQWSATHSKSTGMFIDHADPYSALRAALVDAGVNDANSSPYRVAEFWSSSSPGTKVRMLAEGDDIEQWGKRDDFIRWMDAGEEAPIKMVLHCPACGMQHIDAPEYEGVNHDDGSASMWDNTPHRSHLCAGCGHIWRPADVATEGVASIQTRGKADSCPAIHVKATPADWKEYERISDLPDVDEALRGFSEDPTADNATCVVRAVLTSNPTSDVPNGYRLTDKAVRHEFKYQAWRDAGWTQAQMISRGYLELNPSTGMRCPSCCAPMGAAHADGCNHGDR